MKRMYYTLAALLAGITLMLSIWFVSLHFIERQSISFIKPWLASYISSFIPDHAISVGDIYLMQDRHTNLIKIHIQDIEFLLTAYENVQVRNIEFTASIIDILTLRITKILKSVTIDTDINITHTQPEHTNLKQGDNQYDVTTIKSYLNNHSDIVIVLLQKLEGLALNVRRGPGALPINISLTKVNVEPLVYDKDTLLQINVNAVIQGYSMSMNALLDVKTKECITLSGTIQNLPVILIGMFFPTIQINDDFFINIAFKIQSSALNKVDFLQVQVVSCSGDLIAKDYFSKALVFEKLYAQFICINNCTQLNINNVHITVQDATISANIAKDENSIITGNIELQPMLVNNVSAYWPLPLLPEVRQWLQEHLSHGTVSASVKIKLDLLAILSRKDLKKDAVDVQIHIQDTELFYEQNKLTSPIIIQYCNMLISAHDIIIDIPKAYTLNTIFNDLKGSIQFYGNEIPIVRITSKTVGPVNDLVKIGITHSQSAMTHSLVWLTDTKKAQIPNILGTAHTQVSLNIPISRDELVFSDEMIQIIATLKDLKLDNVLGYDIKGRNVVAKLTGLTLDISGALIVNKILNIDVIAKHDFAKKNSVPEIKIRADINTERAKMAKFAIPNFINGNMFISIVVKILPQSLQIFAHIDLLRSAISLPYLGITKTAHEKGFVQLLLEHTAQTNYKDIILHSYLLNIGSFSSSGSGTISNDLIVNNIISTNTRLGSHKFNFTYRDAQGAKELHLYNGILDFSAADFSKITELQENTAQSNIPFTLTTDLQKVVLKNNIELLQPEIWFKCIQSKCSDIRIVGNFPSHKRFNLFYSDPIISIVSNSAHESLAAFNISHNIREGELELKCIFQEDGNLNGAVTLTNFYIKHSPLLETLLSLSAATSTSFISIVDVFKGKGIHFSKLYLDLTYGSNNIAFFKNVIAKGPTISIKGYGSLNIANKQINAIGTVIPVNIVNTIVSKIPIIGDLLSGGKDGGVISVTFRVKGNILGKTAIVVNPLSVFIPGFLTEAFVENERISH